MPESRKGPVVLIVDDEAAVREILLRWLSAAGYETDQAASADEALERAAAHEVAVALCDVEMPVRNGLWLVERMRERFPSVALVLATAIDTVPGTISLRTGVVAYLLKPFDRNQVLGAVKQAVVWHRGAVARVPNQAATAETGDEWLSSDQRDDLE